MLFHCSTRRWDNVLIKSLEYGPFTRFVTVRTRVLPVTLYVISGLYTVLQGKDPNLPPPPPTPAAAAAKVVNGKGVQSTQCWLKSTTILENFRGRKFGLQNPLGSSPILLEEILSLFLPWQGLFSWLIPRNIPSLQRCPLWPLWLIGIPR